MTNDCSKKETASLTHDLPNSGCAPQAGKLTVLLSLMLLVVVFIGNAKGQPIWDSSDNLEKKIEYGGWGPYVSCLGYQSAFAQEAGLLTKYSCAVKNQTPVGDGTVSVSHRAAGYIEDGINPIVEAIVNQSLSCNYCGCEASSHVNIMWPYKVDIEADGGVVDPNKEYPLYVSYIALDRVSWYNEDIMAQVALYQCEGAGKGTMLAYACWTKKYRSYKWDGFQWVEQDQQVEDTGKMYSHLYGEKDAPACSLCGVLEAKVQGAYVKDLWLEVRAYAITDTFWERNKSSFARIVVDPYLYIDPESPLAEQYQVFTHKNYETSEWVPHIFVPIDPNLVDFDQDGYLSDEDCDDFDAAVNPGAEEVWGDGIDNNCDGWADYIIQVTNTNDSGPGSLRQAIEDANSHPGLDKIAFNIPGAGPHTIQPETPLPKIIDPVIIDGYTQPGAAPATDSSPATLKIELDGIDVNDLHWDSGLNIHAGNSTVRGLVINRFGDAGIHIQDQGGNVIEGNYIGTDVTGTVDKGNFDDGIRIWNAPDNTIGGTTPATRNIISGSNDNGVEILLAGATGNQVQGNYIGVDVTGTISLGNPADGVHIKEGASYNTIGPGNIISGNGSTGVEINGENVTGNEIIGNFIGTDVTGTIGLGNQNGGVLIFQASDNTIGRRGIESRQGNVISGNSWVGIEINGDGATNNIVQDNYIGTDVTGTVALGNTNSGVLMSDGASNNTIGPWNIISGNGNTGIEINGEDVRENDIIGNFIGTDASGNSYLPNGYVGVSINNAPENVVGGIEPGCRNVVTDVHITSPGATDNMVIENYIGIKASGDGKLSDEYTDNIGVLISEASYNVIGGNVVSGHARGICIWAGSLYNWVLENYVGTDATGQVSIGNEWDGVTVNGSHNTIEDNVVSASGSNGIYVSMGWESGDEMPSNNVVEENIIGMNASMDTALPNGNGICINTAVNTTVSENVIAGNRFHGVVVTNDLPWNPGQDLSVGNLITQNAIYDNGELGINLIPYNDTGPWVTPNDDGDTDTGPNKLMNYPVLTSALASPGGLIVKGTIDTQDPIHVVFEFFANSAPDNTGFGEGEIFLGKWGADAQGNFTVVLPPISQGMWISATATDPDNNTSEFAESIEITPNTPEGFNISVEPVDETTGDQLVTVTFAEVTDTGVTGLATSSSGLEVPSGFELAGVYYDITTTASYTPPVTVCIQYDDVGMTQQQEEALRLYHYYGGAWVDVTNFPVDTVKNIICGTVASLSTFAIFKDVAPPEINSISASPSVLWPPNHKMVEVTVTLDVEDNSGQEPFCYIVGVTSNEPINDSCDGNTEPDWQYTDDPLIVLLRAERAGSGCGRIYTICVNCTDASGNTATETVDVTVPHDKGKGKKPGKQGPGDHDKGKGKKQGNQSPGPGGHGKDKGGKQGLGGYDKGKGNKQGNRSFGHKSR